MATKDSGGLEFLFTGSATAAECTSVDAWWPGQVRLCARYANPAEAAIAGGFAADRLAWAFCSGYQTALRRLIPDLPVDALASFCVTEAAGNHPRAIQTTIVPNPDHSGQFFLDGHKRWTTLGPESSLLLVVARIGGTMQSERVALKMVVVRRNAPGVSLRAMSEIRFIPEVAHAEVQLARVSIGERELLEGDAYTRYVKPFRTIEDLHVHAAVLAYMLREARRLHWPHAWIERTLANLYALVAIAQRDPSSPATHIALAGALATGVDLVQEADPFWQAATGDPAEQRWRRDRALLSVASAARGKRLERAWSNILEANSAKL